MNEFEQRRTAKELFECAEEIPRLMRRIDGTLKLPNLTGAQTRDIEIISQRNGGYLKAIREAAIAEGNEFSATSNWSPTKSVFGRRLRKQMAFSTSCL
jgi:hypothetical protein